MSFSRAKPAGWAFGEILTSAQQNQIDTNQANAVDGVDGGTYNLSAPLSILGDTVTFDTVVVTDFLSVPAATVGTLLTAADASITDDLAVGDDATIGGDLGVTGAITAAGTHLLGPTAFRFKTVIAADADTSITSANAGSVYFVETLTTNRVYTFSGAFTAGQWFLFKHRASGGATLSFNLGGAIDIQEAILWIYNGTAWRFLMLSEVAAV